MTKADAENFVQQIRDSRDPRIENYAKKIYNLCYKYAARRGGMTPRNEE
jgi:hypothetical protein